MDFEIENLHDPKFQESEFAKFMEERFKQGAEREKFLSELLISERLPTNVEIDGPLARLASAKGLHIQRQMPESCTGSVNPPKSKRTIIADWLHRDKVTLEALRLNSLLKMPDSPEFKGAFLAQPQDNNPLLDMTPEEITKEIYEMGNKLNQINKARRAGLSQIAQGLDDLHRRDPAAYANFRRNVMIPAEKEAGTYNPLGHRNYLSASIVTIIRNGGA